MHESERAASTLDVKAAHINSEAAEALQLVADLQLEARNLFSLETRHFDEPAAEGGGRAAGYRRQIELAETISKELTTIRETAYLLQHHAQELRGNIELTSLF